MPFQKGHKINQGIKPRYAELYGDYPTLTEMQINYIKMAADPRNKLASKTNQDIADLMGVSFETIKKYRLNPVIRKTITEEIMMKAADDIGDMVEDLKNMALGKSPYEGISITDQLKAKALWNKIYGKDGEDNKTKKGKTVKESVIDKELEELEREYKADSEET